MKNTNEDNHHHMDNRVIVRVWKLAINEETQSLGTVERFGHVSIELPKENGKTVYVSFCPKDPIGKSWTLPTEGKLQSGLDADIKDEGTKPDYTRCFYTLSLASMKKEFDKFESLLNTNPNAGWYLVPTKIFGKDGESCASLAWRLLVAGDIQRLISTSEISSVSSIEAQGASSNATYEGSIGTVNDSKCENSMQEAINALEHSIFLQIKSPDALIRILDRAKKNELSKYPETHSLTFKPETPLPKHNSMITFYLILVTTIIVVLVSMYLVKL